MSLDIADAVTALKCKRLALRIRYDSNSFLRDIQWTEGDGK
jgi:hypothetical protein